MLYILIIDLFFYQLKLLMFDNVQRYDLIFVGNILDIEEIDIALHNFNS